MDLYGLPGALAGDMWQDYGRGIKMALTLSRVDFWAVKHLLRECVRVCVCRCEVIPMFVAFFSSLSVQ